MSKHDSWITDIFKKGDLLYHVMGGEGSKYDEIINEKLPREVNRLGSDVMKPFAKVDKKINPLRKIGAVDKLSTEIENRPGDAIAAAAGAVFGGGALAGAMGGAGSAGAGAAGSSGSTGALSSMGQYGSYLKNAGRLMNAGSKLAGATNNQAQQPIAQTPKMKMKPSSMSSDSSGRPQPMSSEARTYLEMKDKYKGY